MSKAESGGSWLSNGSNPAQAVSATLPDDSDLAEQRPDVPTPKERVAGLFADHDAKMNTPLSEQHGRKIREGLLDEPETVTHEVPVGEHETREVSKTVARDALPLYAAVIDLLETYEGYRDKKLEMAKGYGDGREDFLVDLGISFDPEYQSKTYAKLKALERQFLGGEYPNGGTCEGAFEQPVTVLFGLTSTAYNVAGSASSGLRPFVDHDREIREAWSGSSSSVRRSLRYVLEDKLGLSSTEYAWWWQAEPHPGDGPAAGYSHSHPVVVLDAAAIDTPRRDYCSQLVTADTFEPVVRRHITECDGAGESAHQITDGEDSAVEVRDGDDIDDFAGYVAEYLSVGPDDDLLERSDEYLLWAASQWATSTQKYSKSETATAAIDADRCEQQWLDPETDQEHCHGERVRPASDAKQRRGIRWVCSECGSHHGIDQSEESLVRMRLDGGEAAATSAVATDGGTAAQSDTDADAADSSTQPPLSERWPSATAAASVGGPTRERECDHAEPDTCPLCATETESPDHTVSGETPIPDSATAPVTDSHVVGFEREPQWRADAIVQAWGGGGRTSLGAPGGAQFGEVQVPGHGSVTDKTSLSYLPNAETVEGPEPWRDTALFTEADVRNGDVPPPEVVAAEWAEVAQSGRRVTPKQWPNDWYSRRYAEAGDSSDCADAADVKLTEAEADAVRELVRVESVTSPVAVCGRLSINPDLVEAVRDVIEGDI